MRPLVGMVCAIALAIFLGLSAGTAQTIDPNNQNCQDPQTQMVNPSTGLCETGVVYQPGQPLPPPPWTCGQWCLCSEGRSPGANSCSPCQTSSSLICFPFEPR